MPVLHAKIIMPGPGMHWLSEDVYPDSVTWCVCLESITLHTPAPGLSDLGPLFLADTMFSQVVCVWGRETSLEVVLIYESYTYWTMILWSLEEVFYFYKVFRENAYF